MARRDGAAVVAAVGDHVPASLLQFVGDGLLMALAQDIESSAALACRCSSALQDREWAGDDELAAELEAALGQREPSPLVPLAVDLEDLSELIEAGLGESGGRIDLH